MDKKVYFNGEIVTVNENGDIADAILIENGLICAVGNREEIFALGGEDSEKIDMMGKTMLPGFIDSHGHIVSFAQTLTLLDMSACRSVKDMTELAAQRLKSQPLSQGEWLLGFGYDDTSFSDKSSPTKFELDGVSSTTPIFISHVSGHVAVANSAALEKLEYTGDDYIVPNGGRVQTVSHDSKEPNGILEENAFLAPEKKKLIPLPSSDTMAKALIKAQNIYAGYGITTAQEAGADKSINEILLKAAKDGALFIDIVAHAVQSETFDLLKNEGTPKRDYLCRYKLMGGKTWLDGSLQGKTAWLTRPYKETPKGETDDYCGFGTQSDEQLTEYLKGCIERRIQVNAHANGDAAADQFLRCYKKALSKTSEKCELRPVIVHAQTISEDQLDEIKSLNMIPTFFSDHVWFWGDYHYETSLGPERAERISPLGSALRKGIRFTMHQDAPVKMPDEILTIHNAVNRRTQKGRVLGEEQRLSVIDAIRAVTINGAYQYFEEDIKGTLEAGKYADLVILDKNPLKVRKELIKDIRILETVKQGRTIFKKQG